MLQFRHFTECSPAEAANMAVRCENFSSYKQDSFWSWFICFCATIYTILTLGFSNALGVLFPVLMDSFDESREKTAWVTSIIIGVNLSLGPVTSAFLNKCGFRVTAILGCLSCSAGLAMGSFVPSITTLYIAFSLPFAVGQSMIFVSGAIIVTHYFNKRRSIALGLVMAGHGLGTMILGPTLRVLVDVLDWRNTFRVFAGLLAFVSLTGCLLHQKKSPPGENNKATSKKFALNLSLLKDPTIVMLMTTSGLHQFSRLVPYVHLIKYCDDLGIPANKSSTVYLFIGIFASLGRLGGGFLCGIKRINTRLILQAAVNIMGVSTMLLTLAKTYGAVVAYAITFSAADGLTTSTLMIECLKSVEQSKKASVFGLQMLFGGMFALSSPPLSGLMADTYGNYFAAFLMAGGVGIANSLIPFLLLCVKQETAENTHLDIENAVSEDATNDITQQQSGEREIRLPDCQDVSG